MSKFYFFIPCLLIAFLNIPICFLSFGYKIGNNSNVAIDNCQNFEFLGEKLADYDRDI